MSANINKRVAINGDFSSLSKLTTSQPTHQKYGTCDEPIQRGSTSTPSPTEPAPSDLLERAANKIPCFGIMLSLCASFFLGSAGMLVKLTTSVHGIQVAVLRACVQLLVYLVIMFWRKLPLLPETRAEMIPVMGRASLGASSITCSYYALKLIPLGDATVIRFSLPIWVLIVAYLLLDETCNLIKLLAIVVSMSGVVLIAKPQACIYLFHLLLNQLNLESNEELKVQWDEYNRESGGSEDFLELGSDHFKGCLLALASSICLAMSLIALRLCKRTPAEITILWLSIYSILLGSGCLLVMGEWRLPSNLLDWLFVVLNGLCGAAGQWFITSALKVEQSGIISLARTADIQVAFLYSAFLLHEQIRATSIVGSVLVSSGVIAVVIPQWLKSRNSNGNHGAGTNDAEAANSISSSTNTYPTSTLTPAVLNSSYKQRPVTLHVSQKA